MLSREAPCLSFVVFSLHLPLQTGLAVSANPPSSSYCTENVNLSYMAEEAVFSLRPPVIPDNQDNCDITYHWHSYLHPIRSHFKFFLSFHFCLSVGAEMATHCNLKTHASSNIFNLTTQKTLQSEKTTKYRNELQKNSVSHTMFNHSECMIQNWLARLTANIWNNIWIMHSEC